jgi:hypothetical protein
MQHVNENHHEGGPSSRLWLRVEPVEIYQRFRNPCCLRHQGDRKGLWNVGKFLSDYTALQPSNRRQNFKSHTNPSLYNVIQTVQSNSKSGHVTSDTVHMLFEFVAVFDLHVHYTWSLTLQNESHCPSTDITYSVSKQFSQYVVKETCPWNRKMFPVEVLYLKPIHGMYLLFQWLS